MKTGPLTALPEIRTEGEAFWARERDLEHSILVFPAPTAPARNLALSVLLTTTLAPRFPPSPTQP